MTQAQMDNREVDLGQIAEQARDICGRRITQEWVSMLGSGGSNSSILETLRPVAESGTANPDAVLHAAQSSSLLRESGAESPQFQHRNRENDDPDRKWITLGVNYPPTIGAEQDPNTLYQLAIDAAGGEQAFQEQAQKITSGGKDGWCVVLDQTSGMSLDITGVRNVANLGTTPRYEASSAAVSLPTKWKETNPAAEFIAPLIVKAFTQDKLSRVAIPA